MRRLNSQALVLGGGPAGCAAATVLAQQGRKVVLLEKDRFPRYHVGESLIPFCYFTLERLGMIPKLKASHFVKKYSVQFAAPDGRISTPFYFFQHFDHPAAQTWQVLRSEFDQMMLDNAREHGVDVVEQAVAGEHLFDGQEICGVRGQLRDGEAFEAQANITIDCTGRDCFTANRLGWRIRDPQLSKVAVWSYYRGARRDSGLEEGATTVAFVQGKGWFWYIPLHDDLVSVGITADKDYLYRHGRDPAAILAGEIQENRWIAEHLASATCTGEYRVTGDYSYRSRYCACDGLVLAGDAFAFLDPVFSSGVFLALKSGELAGQAAHEALSAGDVSAGRFSDYCETVLKGVETFRRIVYAFYQEGFSFGKMIRANPQVHGDVTDCLIGNFEKDLEPMFAAAGQFAELPAPLPYGRPHPSGQPLEMATA